MSDLLSAGVLVVNQKAKLIEMTNQYAIKDADGNDIGRIEQKRSHLTIRRQGRLVRVRSNGSF